MIEGISAITLAEWRHETAPFLVSNLVLFGGWGRRYNRRVSDGTNPYFV